MNRNKWNTWWTGEIEHGGNLVLVRHRLHIADEVDPAYEWLAIVTHHLARVQSIGLPEAAYNDSLQYLDGSIITSLQAEDGDMVVLIETCSGKRAYYAYVHAHESVGCSVQRVITENPEQRLSFRTAFDPAREFVRRYISRLRSDPRHRSIH